MVEFKPGQIAIGIAVGLAAGTILGWWFKTISVEQQPMPFQANLGYYEPYRARF